MRNRLFVLFVIALSALMVAVAATAEADSTHGAIPGVYDPDATGCPTAEWTPAGLVLSKPCDTSTNAAAGADIVGFNGDTLTGLSFDILNGSHIGAGSPRFDVVFTDGTFRIFVAHYASDQEDLDNGYTRYTFDDQTPFCDFASSEPETCGFGQTVAAIDVLLDEEGVATISNITVNGDVLNGPPTGSAAAPQVNRDGYCAAHDMLRVGDGSYGRFVDLQDLQPSMDDTYAGAVPAYFVQGQGERCEVPYGFHLDGKSVSSDGVSAGVHPHAVAN